MSFDESFADQTQSRDFLPVYRLKKRGETIRFRILRPKWVHRVMHIFQQGRWRFYECPRAQAPEAYCQWCEKYQELAQPYFELLRERDSGVEIDSSQLEQAKKKCAPYRQQHQYHFLVLNRYNCEYGDLQLSAMAVGQLKQIFEQAGSLNPDLSEADFLLDNEFVLTRTEGNPYYLITRLDSGEIKPFTPTEKDQVKQAKGQFGEDFSGFLDYFQPPKKQTYPTVQESDIPF